ncbi:hypothetical protein H634G_09269 [Metarhizium anisopliae BRIP 53293]|uniref:Uncharacterized protein n=1 Tax=Metarhizium anisopliae BRIP 53293 TaxID=1291518 RepID=A0A0D9NPL2_METAN|nr:hypothetical protein H634G_09269 [Metarhizium anisopliae BRIP 53293]KJK87929.1 hypothetical protein H633G_08214 [Metarhizium anisopliae BRIP 53284]
MEPVAILLAFLQLRLACATYDDAFPRCSSCLSAVQHDAPGIGFGLTPNTGTVSAHLFNETILDIAEISAEHEYQALMLRLTTAPRPEPLSSWEKLSRTINKSLGRPATADVGILARHLGRLRDAAQRRLPGQDVDSVAISLSPVRGLRLEDVEDALTHVGLKSWIRSDHVQAGLYPTLLTEPHAVYAAHGQGLCHDYKNLFECWEEEEHFARETLLVAGLTPTELRVEVAQLKAPFAWCQALKDYVIELRAGLDSLPVFASPQAYWEHVQTTLEAFLSQIRGPLPTSIMLLSADATRPEFSQALRHALSHYHYIGTNLTEPKYHTALLGFPDQFGPSRGAAQYARWRREAPLGCREDKRCDDERDKERSGVSKLVPGLKGELK